MRRNNNMASRGGGPLLTDHLQDLELELELLKRKRQLIQHQQNEMLYRGPTAERSSFGQQPRMFNDQFNEPQRHSFSQLYDAAPRPVQPFAPKRRAEPAWAGSAGDRFDTGLAPNKRPRQGSFPQRYPEPKSSQAFQRPRANRDPLPSLLATPKPKPLMNFSRGPPAQRQAGKQGQGPRGPAARQPNFKVNTKQFGPRPGFSSAKSGPNKPSFSPAKPGPNKTFNPVPAKPKQENSVVYSPNAELSPKVRGRLELALGNILKEIRKAHSKPDNVLLFTLMPLARLMKQCIRERIRSVMVGKVIGSVPDIVAEYRKQFPESTDVEIVQLAEVEKLKQDQTGELAIKLFEEGDPEKYFKKNVNKLIDVKLDEMFKKIEKVYTDENSTTVSEILENLPEVKKDPKAEPVTTADDQEKTESNGETKASKEQEYDKWMALLVERKLPRLLAKHKDHIIRVLNIDQMFSTTKAAIIVNSNNKALTNIMNQKDRYSIDATPSKNDPKLPRSLPYFAKVLSNPAMPKRKLMQDFLNQFNPKTIKRHKKNYNLLFVGFAAKEDFDKILAADQTQIGNATLTIVGSASSNGVSNDSVNEVEDQNTSDASIDQVITPQLDDQITDLLTSIRKADEEAKTNSDSANDEEVVAVDEVENGEMEAKTDATADVDDCDVKEIKDDQEVVTIEDDDVAPLKSEEADDVAPLKSEDDKVQEVSTPAKGRAPATPSTIRTRRASRLAQNN